MESLAVKSASEDTRMVNALHGCDQLSAEEEAG